MLIPLILSSLLLFIMSSWRVNVIHTASQSSLLTNTADGIYQPSKAFYVLLNAGILLSIIVFAYSLLFILGHELPNVSLVVRGLVTLFATLLFVYLILYATNIIFRRKLSKKRLFPTKYSEENPLQSMFIENNDALEMLTDDDEDENDPVELFENALGLFSIEISECLIPRKEIVGVELTNSIEEIKQVFIDSKHSKLIVYENDMDNILGYIHHSDFYSDPEDIKNLVREIPTVLTSMTAIEMLSYFKKKQKSIAWVVDEFGGTEGILTTEDLLEELFGEIQDEHDESEYIEQQISNNEFVLSARLEVEYINDKFDLEIPTEKAETLSGYIIEEHNEIPTKNEKIVIDQYEFKILQVSKTRIETVRLKVLS